jgi:WD40 repeat protein
MLIQLSEYVTQIAWSLQGETLAAASAAGEVVLIDPTTEAICTQLLDDRQNQSIDALDFSADGIFLAAGGQAGWLSVWRMDDAATLILSQDLGGWIERLAWHPILPLCACSCGKQVQIWDMRSQTLKATFDFEQSSIWALAWHPNGQWLAVSGYQGTQVWALEDDRPSSELLEVASAAVSLAWSPDGKYIATGNLDKTIALWEWENPHPWVMRGFPGKVQQLAWPPQPPVNQPHLFASASAEGIVIWQKADEATGWDGQVLGTHTETITAIAWHPELPYLASASEDGRVNIWAIEATDNVPLVALQGAEQGFTQVLWHPVQNRLAAGGRCGEVVIWTID